MRRCSVNAGEEVVWHFFIAQSWSCKIWSTSLNERSHCPHPSWRPAMPAKFGNQKDHVAYPRIVDAARLQTL